MPELIAESETATEAYERLMPLFEELGGVKVQEKKGSLLLVSGAAAFLGIQTRKEGLRLIIVLARTLEGPRIVKTEQVSKARFHNEVNFPAGQKLDSELRGWIAEAHRLQNT